MLKKQFHLIAVAAVVLFAADMSAAPAARHAAVKRTATTVKRTQRAAAAGHARARAYGYRYYYWYDDDDCHHHDYVKNATCILKVCKVCSSSSGIFEVKCSVGYVSVENAKQGVDYSLREKQRIRIDGIDMSKRHSGDTLYLPSSKNLWYNGEYRDPQGKVYSCYTLDQEEGISPEKKK